MEPITAWGATKSNAYWGRRSGSIVKDGTRAFKQRKWGNGSINSGPAGWKAKRARRGRI